ncbi:MAG: Urocanate reductase precursor [Chloroflexi bacterium ADurb.Bin325]|nr:MAG: Urocanate reductase precursor [Chloroflexi bacterium ADurb.Bin325]
MRSDNNGPKKISRRDFFRGAGLSAAAMAGASFANAAPAFAQQGNANTDIPSKWDLEADVVVIGSGAVGLPAAIRAVDAKASVIVVECNYDIGGHAIISGGNVPLGGGTSFQKKYDIEDSPDIYFRDLTDWSVVETGGSPDYRYNDRGIQRALADNSAPCFEFLLENGVPFVDKAPDNSGAHGTGISAKREHHTIWDKGQSLESPAGAGGTSLMRALEASARKKGVKFLLNYHMDVIYRETPNSGRVLGIQASYSPTILPGETTPLKSFASEGNIDMTAETVTIRAKKAVIIGTGGSTGNVNFRRIFDPRATEELILAGEPYSPQDASGELAAMAIGASLWGTANHTGDRNGYIRRRPIVGTKYVYVAWTPKSPIFPLCKATGLRVTDWQNGIIVNQAGKRFYNEFEEGYPGGTREGSLDPYKPGDWRNLTRIKYNPRAYVDAALAINELSEPPDYAAGPQWAIFDSEAVARQKWDLDDPATDPEYFFSADTLAELAEKLVKNPYQKKAMPAKNLEETVARYNMMVDLGVDPDFDKPAPKYKIEKPPFYAAWATPAIHDTYAGLRINMQCQVQDMNGEVIPGLYCGGESAGGSSQHGLARCLTQGYIAGAEAAAEKV